jgi:NAD(P)-dependent dehydrogenase (short-subunit alcohol dehydrogenase family)
MISESLRNPLSIFDVRGKSALITGASGAFGRATAIALGALGANITMAGSSKRELDEVANEVREVGAEVTTAYARPDSLADADRMRDAALETYGRQQRCIETVQNESHRGTSS